MPFTIVQRDHQEPHLWCLTTATCRLDDAADVLIRTTVTLVRRSYGEDEILRDAAEVLAPEISAGTFRVDHLLAAFREGLPNPSVEGRRPPALTTYRSQTAEMVAKAALANAYNFEYPAAPQEGSTNANQPILGFDGWGLVRNSRGEYSLALIQVKATDDPDSPPSEADALAEECLQVPRDKGKLCRALSALIRHMRGDPLQPLVLQMLARLGDGLLPQMHVAPAIVRGTVTGQMSDLQPVRDVVDQIAPASIRGIVVTIGVPLATFGATVMQKARVAP